jgi:bacteriorhodopsin
MSLIPLQVTPELGSLTTWTLWITAVLMFVGGGAIYWRGRGSHSDEMREHVAISVLIPMWAFAMYVAMATGFGVTSIELITGESQEVFWARYVDWLFTTPLLLLDLALLAKADRETIGSLMAIDAFMIAAGLVGAFTAEPVYRYLWWTISTGAFVVILYGLFASLPDYAKRHSAERSDKFETMRNLLAGVWTVYPVLWLVGSEGFGIVPVGVETVGYAVLDLTAKVGFGLLMTSYTADLASGESRTTDSSAAVADD